MFTQPPGPPLFHKPPMIHAFQSQDANQNLGFLAPFPDRSEDRGSIRDKADYTDSSREPNHEKVFLADGTDNSRYYSASDMTGMKRPRDDWNDHLDVPIKKARDGGGLGGTEDDNLPYQCINYGHRKLDSSMYDSAMGQPSLQKYKSGLQDKDLPNSLEMNDQEFFQLFEDGLDLMIQTDDSIRAILEFDTRLNWILSPIFKDQDIDAVTQVLGQGEEAVAAKKVEKMVWLTKTKIQRLCSEILENISVRRKEAVEQTKYITKPVPSLNNPENQISHGIDDSKEHLNFGGDPTPSYRDDHDSHQLMSQDLRRPPDHHNQGSFQLNSVPDVSQQIQLIPHEFPLPPVDMFSVPLLPFRMPPLPLPPFTMPLPRPLAPLTMPPPQPLAPLTMPPPQPLAPLTMPPPQPLAPFTMPPPQPLAPFTMPPPQPLAPFTMQPPQPLAPLTMPPPQPLAPSTMPTPRPLAPFTKQPLQVTPAVTYKKHKTTKWPKCLRVIPLVSEKTEEQPQCLSVIPLVSEKTEEQPRNTPVCCESKQNILTKKEDIIFREEKKKEEKKKLSMALKQMPPKKKLIYLIHRLNSWKGPVWKMGLLQQLIYKIGHSILNVDYKVTAQGNSIFGSLTVDGLFITRRKADNKEELKEIVYKRAYIVLKVFPVDVIIELGDPNADGTETLKVEKFNLITHIKKIQNVLASQKDGCDLPEVLLHKINKSFTESLPLYLVIKEVKRPNSCLYFMVKLMLDDCILARVYTPSVETASEKAYISAMERIKNLSAKEIAYEKGLEVVDEVAFGKGLEVVDEVAFGKESEKGLEVVDEVAFGKESEKGLEVVDEVAFGKESEKGLEVVDEVAFGKEWENGFRLSLQERFEKIMALIKKTPPFQIQSRKEDYLNKIAAKYNLPHSLVYQKTCKNDAQVSCNLYLGDISVAYSKGNSVGHARSLAYGDALHVLCSKPFGFIKSRDRLLRFKSTLTQIETASEKAYISAMEREKNLSAKEIAYEKGLEVVDEVAFGKGLEVVDEVAFGKGLEVVDEVAFGKGLEVVDEVAFGKGLEVVDEVAFGKESEKGLEVVDEVAFGKESEKGPEVVDEVAFGKESENGVRLSLQERFLKIMALIKKKPPFQIQSRKEDYLNKIAAKYNLPHSLVYQKTCKNDAQVSCNLYLGDISVAYSKGNSVGHARSLAYRDALHVLCSKKFGFIKSRDRIMRFKSTLDQIEMASEKDYIKERFEEIMALIKKKPPFLEQNKKKNYLHEIVAKCNLPHSLVYPRKYKNDGKVSCKLYIGSIFVAYGEGSSGRHARSLVYEKAWYTLCNKPFEFIKNRDRWKRSKKLSRTQEHMKNRMKKEHHKRSASALCPKEEFGNDKHLSQTEATK